MATKVEGEQYYGLDGQLLEIKRQLRQENGYPFNPEDLKRHLQEAIEGRFKKRWREEDKTIYFEVTSDGTTGEAWITSLTNKGFCLSDYAKQLLCSEDFIPTNGVTYKIAVLKGMLFEDSNRTTENIRAEAEGRSFATSPPEVACLIRDKISDEELEAMGLYWIITMHEPIKDSDGGPGLLGAGRGGGGGRLGTYYDYPDYRWSRGGGFAFVVSQVST